MRILTAVLLIVLFPRLLPASDYTDYVDAKKDFLQRDKDYLEYLKQKKKYAADSAEGLAEYRRLKAWAEWRADRARRRYIQARDRKERMPASVLQADEMQYDRQRAAELAGIERDRLKHIRLRDIRNKARNETWAYPLSNDIYRRNLEPWNE